MWEILLTILLAIILGRILLGWIDRYLAWIVMSYTEAAIGLSIITGIGFLLFAAISYYPG